MLLFEVSTWKRKRPRFSHCSKTVNSNYIPLDFMMRNINLILLCIHLESPRGRLVQDVADHVEIACVHF